MYTNPATGIHDFCKQKFCRPLLCRQLDKRTTKSYTNLNDDTVLMTNYCYFESIAQYMGLLRNV